MFDSYTLLCDLISCKDNAHGIGQKLRACRAVNAYSDLLSISYEHLLTPAVYRGLEYRQQLENIPTDLQSFLRQAYTLNLQRNRKIKSEITELVAALDNQNVPSLLLKGSAYLFQTNEKLCAEKMVGDIDLLICRRNLDEALNIFRGLGYSGDEAMALDNHYHGIAMVSSRERAVLDLHIDVGPQRHLLSVGEIFEQSTKIDHAEGSVRVPSPIHQTFHNIFHAEIQSRHHLIGVTSLRQLHDLRLLCETFCEQINWYKVEGMFTSDRYRRIMRCYLYQARELLGLDIPERFTSNSGTRRHALRCRLQRRYPVFTRLPAALAGVTTVFARYRLEYLAGKPLSLLELWTKRLNVLKDELLKYRLGIFSRILKEWKRI